MNGRVLLDTNILVYIYDSLDLVKQDRAIAIVDRLIQTTRAVVTPQVKKQVFVTQLITLEAFRGVETHHFQFWDAQI